MAEPYRPQLSQQSVPMSEATAEDAGAAAARGIEEGGATIDRAIHQRREADRDLEAANAGVELATASTDLDKLAIDARSTAAPGGEGHTEAVAKAIDERQKAALANIRDPDIRAAFTQRWAQLRDNLETREYGWQAGARVDKLAADVDSTGTTLANGMASNPNADGLELSLSTVETSIGEMALPADVKTKLVREQQRKITAAYANALVDKNPRMLVGDEASKTPGLLDKGVLNQYLEPEDIDRLRSGAHVEIRRQDVEARQKLAQEKSDWLENVSVMRTRINSLADYTVTDEELDGLAAGAAKYGDKSTALEITQWRDLRDTAKESRGWTPETWSQHINALEAKSASGKITPQETVRLASLNKLRPAAVSRFNSDPFAAAAAAGTPAPDVDWNDPTSVQRRVTWARSYQRSAGLNYTPIFDNNDLKDLRDRSKQSTAGKLEVAAQLRNSLGGGLAREAVRQIDANDKDLAIMVGLAPRMAQLYKNGVSARERNPKLAGVDADDKAGMQEVFNEFAQAIPDEDTRTAVWNAAVNIMAGRAAEVGRTELTGDELTTEFRRFMHYAGGRLGGDASTKGGFVKWYGRYAWLPQSMNERDFQRTMSRAAKPNWIKAAGGAEPYYRGPDGKLVKMSDAQVAQLARYQVETVRPGVYGLIMPGGGHVGTKDGKLWTFNVDTLAAGEK